VPEFLSKFLKDAREPIEILGFGAQAVFFLRFLVQWLVSERRKEVTIPLAFWWISIAGGLMQGFYGAMKPAPNLVVAQAVAIFIYSRNIVLHRRKERALAGTQG
jgi:lipid-A-disaccharide synthase-like uncharacterized protein